MAKLKRKKKEEPTEESPKINIVGGDLTIPIETTNMLSTGSTLLDLNISGKRRRGGGIPGGILAEVFGRSGCGKTALLVEVCASAQYTGGHTMIQDPEARLDKEYAHLFGAELNKDNYFRPKYVSELFEAIDNWETDPKCINVIAADSLAAFSTETEMEKGDKRGQMRAKAFSEGARKMALKLADQNRIVICSNQVRQGDYGDITPGGNAIPFYSSLRIKMKQVDKIEKSRSLKKGKGTGKSIKKVMGIWSECEIVKNSIDDPFRVAPIRLIFGHGIDDIGANIQWLKDVRKDTTYYGKYARFEDAIKHVEHDELESKLREEVIDTWLEIESMFKQNRKPKKRFIL